MNNSFTILGNCSLFHSSDKLLNAAVKITPIVITLILGLPVNIYILQLILSRKRHSIASEFFMLNQAISEILICVCSILGFVEYISYENSVKHARSFFLGLMTTGRPLILACLCVERYLAVVKPIFFLRYKPLRYKLASSGLIWLVTLSCCLASLFMCLDFFSLCLVQVSVCFGVKLYCCGMTLWVLKQPGPGEGNREREGMNSMKLKAFRAILIITISVVLSYFPSLALMFFRFCISDEQFVNYLNICYILTIAAGLVPSLLYLQRTGKL